MRKIILASQSPRRSELLRAMGVQFEIIVSDFEEYLDHARSPEEVAQELGLGKALAVARLHPEALVIGSDTIVTIDGQQLAKAESDDEARHMLQLASQHPNLVTSSLAVVCLEDNLQLVSSENAWVYFKPYDEAAVEVYVKTGDYKDKAGAYGIQTGAAPLIDHLQGHIDTMIGLPTHLLAPILQSQGYDAQSVEYVLSDPIPIS